MNIMKTDLTAAGLTVARRSLLALMRRLQAMGSSPGSGASHLAVDRNTFAPGCAGPEARTGHRACVPVPFTQVRNSVMRFAASLSLLLALGACGGGAGGTDPAPVVQVQTGFTKPAAARAIGTGGATQVIADRQVLVTMAEDVTPAQYDAVIAQVKRLKVDRIGELRDLRMLQITVQVSGGEADVINAVKSLPGVTHAGYNIAVETTRENPPSSGLPWTDPLPSRAHKLAAASTIPGRYWEGEIDLAAAREVEDGLGIKRAAGIAVVDTGMPAAQNLLAESRLRRVDANGSPLTDDETIDVKTHGSWVIAFAAGSSTLANGVSRYSDVLSVDVYSSQCQGVFAFFGCPADLGRVFQTDLAEGVQTALRSDARVINVSWGREAECSASLADRLDLQRGFRETMKPLVNLARKLDKLLVFASGNKCEKQDDQLLDDVNDVAADSWTSHALIVGASNSSRHDALFSRMGRVVDLMAPGEDVSWGKGTGSGTSYAAPLVTGVAAMLQGVAPNMSAPETRYLVLNGAEPALTFTDAKAAKYRGYNGESAATPNLLLKAGNSARAAKLVREVPLKVLDGVSLKRGEAKDVSFEVEVPSTGVRALDLVFAVDGTGSYGDDIASLRRQAGGIVDALLARGIDVQFAVTAFADFPQAPYGDAGDLPFRRITRMTADKAAVLAGINALQARGGNDTPEAQLEALYQIATGAGRDLNGDRVYDTARGEVEPQPVGWRTGAAKVVLLATDASFHNADAEAGYPGAGFTAAVAALKAQGIRVIGLQSGSDSAAAADIGRLVAATGGSVYQLSVDSAQFAQAVAAGIDSSLAEVDLTVETVAGASWITKMSQGKPKGKPGEKVTFTVSLTGQRSQSVDDLAYDIYLWVRGNGSALLQRVRIPVTVPR